MVLVSLGGRPKLFISMCIPLWTLLIKMSGNVYDLDVPGTEQLVDGKSFCVDLLIAAIGFPLVLRSSWLVSEHITNVLAQSITICKPPMQKEPAILS